MHKKNLILLPPRRYPTSCDPAGGSYRFLIIPSIVAVLFVLSSSPAKATTPFSSLVFQRKAAEALRVFREHPTQALAEYRAQESPIASIDEYKEEEPGGLYIPRIQQALIQWYLDLREDHKKAAEALVDLERVPVVNSQTPSSPEKVSRDAQKVEIQEKLSNIEAEQADLYSLIKHVKRQDAPITGSDLKNYLGTLIEAEEGTLLVSILHSCDEQDIPLPDPTVIRSWIFKILKNPIRRPEARWPTVLALLMRNGGENRTRLDMTESLPDETGLLTPPLVVLFSGEEWYHRPQSELQQTKAMAYMLIQAGASLCPGPPWTIPVDLVRGAIIKFIGETTYAQNLLVLTSLQAILDIRPILREEPDFLPTRRTSRPPRALTHTMNRHSAISAMSGYVFGFFSALAARGAPLPEPRE